MLSVTVDLSEFNRMIANVEPSMMRGIRVGLKQCAKELIAEGRRGLDSAYNISAHSLAPRSIQVDDDKTTPTSITVGINKTTCPYAIYLHEGTKDHKVPKTGHKFGKGLEKDGKPAALHWVSGGDSFFSKGHKVSGIEKHPFLYDAAYKLKDKFGEIIHAAVQSAMKKEGVA